MLLTGSTTVAKISFELAKESFDLAKESFDLAKESFDLAKQFIVGGKESFEVCEKKVSSL